MNKQEIRNYLENNLKSNENDIMDNCDRLVWISDVTDAVVKLFSIPDVIVPKETLFCEDCQKWVEKQCLCGGKNLLRDETN